MENVGILQNILLKVVHHYLIYDKSALVQEMAWRRSGAMPFLGAMMTKIV